MSKRLIDRISFAKITTILAISFGIGMGLCGLSFVFPSRGNEWGMNGLSLPSLLVMLISFLGLIITLATRMIVGVINSFSDKGSGPQKLFDDSEEDSNGKD